MATLPRLGVSQRVLISAVLSAVLAVLLVFIALGSARNLVRSYLVEQIAEEADLTACEENPEHWGTRLGPGFSIFAYDTQGQSLHPDAPPLEAELLAQLSGPESMAQSNWGKADAVSVLQTASSGPCAVLRLSGREPGGKAFYTMLAVLLSSTFAVMLLAGLGSYYLVVRPMRQRIAAISLGAKGVGEPEFQPASEQLDDALGDISRVLEDSHSRILNDREELLRRQSALEEHLAGIAHDLRTPLSSMQLSLEVLASDPEQLSIEAVELTLADVVYLSDLVENLHQGARLRQGLALDQGRVDLRVLVERLGSRFEIIGRHAGVSVAVNLPEQPVWAKCVPAMAERAIANLIQNAVGHNRRGGNVAVVLSASQGSFELAVLDDGPGLPAELHHSLQSPTFLEDQARQRGPGLGMLITHEIALRVHWSVAYRAMEPSGLRVVLKGACEPAQTPRV